MESQFSLPLLAVLIAPIAFVLAGIWASLPVRRAEGADRSIFVFDGAAILGIIVAIGAALNLGLNGAASTPTLGFAELGLSVRLDGLSVVLFSMVSLLAVVIVRFSRTYLEGDARRHVFMRRIAFTIAAVELLLVAGNIALFVAAWIVTSATLHGLLLFYRERRGAQNAARKKFFVARLSEIFMIGAASLVYLHFGTGDIGAIIDGAAGAEPTARLTAAAILLGLAALTKSAQFPLHGWLLEVMETPTPVSALLHAGILNAGPYLLCRFASVFEVSLGAQALVISVGAFTALFASTALMTQPAVKVSLAFSSSAHMGFSLLLCGFGAYGAAVLHLVAHSFYKAHAFLSSGSVVERARAAGVSSPPTRRNPVRIVAGIAVALAIYIGVATLLGLGISDELGLLVLGAVVVMGMSQFLGSAFDRSTSPAVLLQSTALGALVAVSFFGLETLSNLILSGAVPASRVVEPAHLMMAGVVISLFAVATIIQISRPASLRKVQRAAWVHVRNGFYVNVLLDRLTGAFDSQQTR